MSLGRALLCILFPPLAVADRGCGTVLIVLALTLAGWIPGAIAALLINLMIGRDNHNELPSSASIPE